MFHLVDPEATNAGQESHEHAHVTFINVVRLTDCYIIFL